MIVNPLFIVVLIAAAIKITRKAFPKSEFGKGFIIAILISTASWAVLYNVFY